MAWRVLDAQYTRVPGFPYAIPQRRRRVFVVGYFGDWTRAAKVLLEPDRLQWDTPTRKQTKEAAAGTAGKSSFWNGEDVASTLTEELPDARMPDKGKLPCVICVHGSQDPICSSNHAHAVNRNNGLENVICYENHSADARIKSTDVSPIILAR